MKTNYDRDYFIAKFESTQDAQWITGVGVQGKKRCALGHCGEDNLQAALSDYGEEAAALIQLFTPYAEESVGNFFDFGVVDINDGRNPKFPQPTPRARVLAALRALPPAA